MTVNELKKALDEFNYPDDPEITVEGYNIKRVVPAKDWTLDLEVEGGSMVDSSGNLEEEITGLYEEINDKNEELYYRQRKIEMMDLAINKALPYLQDYLTSLQRNKVEFEKEKKDLKYVIEDLENAQEYDW